MIKIGAKFTCYEDIGEVEIIDSLPIEGIIKPDYLAVANDGSLVLGFVCGGKFVPYLHDPDAELFESTYNRG